MYRLFRDPFMRSAFEPMVAEAFFYREAEVPCRHRLPRRVWDRVRWGYRHPATHPEVVETWHARKPLRVTLIDHWPPGRLLGKVDWEGDIVKNGEGLTISWKREGWPTEDVPPTVQRDWEGDR